MKTIKITTENIIYLIISSLITAIITGFSSELIKKYIKDSQLSIPKFAFNAVVLILIILITLAIIFFLLKGIVFCYNYFKRDNRPSVEDRFDSELNRIETQVAKIKEKCYKNDKIKKHETLSVLNIIKSVPEFLYNVIPQKIENSKLDKKTENMLYSLNRERIKILINDCLEILKDIYNIYPNLKNDSVLEEQFYHLLDELTTYAD